MLLARGARLGSYEIAGPIGEGGMGEVYEAKDVKLGRTVAVKVLPEAMAADAQRLRRFEQEARAASALNHPNIVTIYEIGEHEGRSYIAMEYVEGKTLREILEDGPLANEKLLRYGTQMAEGLAKAHQAGIVHRDLKPENIVISNDGYVKILDFGLAKLMPLDDAGSDVATMEQNATTPGAILGTVSYMSPEQAKGEPADFRSDQFSFGAVLYEMATGRRAFQRDTPAQTLTAIIEDDPELVTLVNPKVAAAAVRVIDRCLAKDPKERFDSVWDIVKKIHREELSAPVLPAGRFPLAAAGIVGLLAIILVMALGLFVPEVREWVSGGLDAPVIDSIAVLPLENLSGDPEQEYFADAMTDMLIADLAKIEALKVISRTSVMQYKGAREPLPEIARALRVDGIVAGSVFREGDRVRINVQLIDAPNDRLLWTERYERELTNVLSLQGEVARTIAREIEVNLTPVEEARLAKVRSVDKEAQDAFFRGRFFAAQDTVEGSQRALGYYQESVARDPDYALAHAELAQAYSSLGFFGALSPRDAYPKARVAAERALELEELAEAHATLGYIASFYDWDWTAGEREFERAFELNPNYATAHLFYHWLLTAVGREQAAARELETALELDPLSMSINANVAWHASRAGEYDKAVAEATKTLELNPSYTHALWFRGIAYLQTHRTGEAIADFEAAAAISETPDLLAWLGNAYALAGRRDEALAILSELEQRAETRYVPADRIAVIYIGLGEVDRAFDYLEQAFEERSGFMIYLEVDPVFDLVRDDPRFQDLVDRMNFPE